MATVSLSHPLTGAVPEGGYIRNRKIKIEKGEKGKEVGTKKAEVGEVTQNEKEKSDLMKKYLKLREKLEKAKEADDAVAREAAEMEISEILRKLSEAERKIRKAADTKKHNN